MGSLFLFLFVIFMILVASGQRGGDTFSDNLVLSIPGIIGDICAVFAFSFGVFSIIRRKERSVFVLLFTALGFFILTFMLGEFLGPH